MAVKNNMSMFEGTIKYWIFEQERLFIMLSGHVQDEVFQ